MNELKEKIKNLQKRLETVFPDSKLDTTRQKILHLETESLKSDFWADTQKASEAMQQLSQLQEEKTKVENISSSLKTLAEFADLAQTDLDLEEEVKKVEQRLEAFESLEFLSGEYDKQDALVTIHAGQGGVEAMDWASMLMRMYLRYADNKGWSETLIDETKGEEAGIKEASLEIKGQFAYGLLKREAGTHRLVRQSPFNADNLRQTSFALVEVLPVLPEEETKKIDQSEIEMEAFRASGPGGQNVQKVNTAVRLRHRPSGIVVSAQSERSQLQNRQNALKLLLAKLYLLQEEQKAQAEKKLKGEHKLASWGNQIRSYVLHPYKQVKDLRTEVVSLDPEEVLGGNLETFIEAELRLKS